MTRRQVLAHQWPNEKDEYPTFVWQDASRELVALFLGQGGQGAGIWQAHAVRRALVTPAAGPPAERARALVERAQAAALALEGITAFGSMTCVALGPSGATIAYAGSVRAYAIGAEGTERLTNTPTWREQVEWIQAASPGTPYPWSSAYIGQPEGFAVEIVELPLAPGDALVLCTSAIEQDVGLDRIAAIARAGEPGELWGALGRRRPWRERIPAGAVALIR